MIFNKKNVIIILLLVLLGFMIYIKFFYNKKFLIKHDLTSDKNKTDRPTIINFNTSWCGYSLEFQPIWNSFTETMKSKDIDVIDMKCDKNENKQSCKNYNIRGYPTISLFSDGRRIDYEGERTVQDLSKFVEDNI